MEPHKLHRLQLRIDTTTLEKLDSLVTEYRHTPLHKRLEPSHPFPSRSLLTRIAIRHLYTATMYPSSVAPNPKPGSSDKNHTTP